MTDQHSTDQQIIHIIAALDRNFLIGAAGNIPWHLPADLAHFKRTTMSHPIIMGRTTYESIGHPLPGRYNIILSRDRHYRNEDCQVCHSVSEALEKCRDYKDIFIIGGGMLYQSSIDIADYLHISHIDAEFTGDTYFPAIEEGDWQVIESSHIPADADNPYAICFKTYQRNYLYQSA